MSPPRRINTWSAIVVPWAAKLNLTPQLASIKVENILSGDTCRPISLADFEGYLTFREYSVENLQFVVWYQDYRRRFLDAAPQCHSRHASETKVHVPNRVSIERRAAESSAGPPTSTYDNEASEKKHPILDPVPESREVASAEPAMTAPSSSIPSTVNRQQSLPTIDKPSGAPSSAPSDSTNTSQYSSFPAKDLPFKEECMRVVATFLRPNSPKELNLDATVRDTIIGDLAHSTHPDVFVHAYQEAYDMLEVTSLPRFITHATANINLQKQLYHYAVGFICYSVGITIALTLIMTVNTHHKPHNRAWRLFAMPWFFSGTTTTYSSFRGFCSQVGGRGNLQLRAWELEEPADEESKIFINPTPRCGSQSTHHRPSADENSLEDAKIDKSSKGAVPNLDEIAAIAPFATPVSEEKARMVAPFAEPFGDGRLSMTHPPFADDPRAGKPLIRPKVFGPERVVEDPRIKIVHERFLREMYILALCAVMVFSAIIFSVPCGHHPR